MARAIEVDERGLRILVVRARRVLLHLHLLYADLQLFALGQAVDGRDLNKPILRERVIVLRDLIAGGLVVVEVVLAIEAALGLDGAL
jgi:hypothetical protein